MCNYPAPKQFAYIDPQGEFRRLTTQIWNDDQMRSCQKMIDSQAVYESVYGWTGWQSGQITAAISKDAIIDGVFLDFDDAEDPGKALMDAAEVAQYIGHSVNNFSGAKGAHLWIRCYPVDLIPDLKGHVIRQFVNELCDRLPELSTLDFSVVGDTSRVRRIIDSVHPKTKLHAIGLSAEELSLLSIDEVRSMAENSRGLTQVPGPSQWVTDMLYCIEGVIIDGRLKRLHDRHLITDGKYENLSMIRWIADNRGVFDFITMVENDYRQSREKKHIDLRGSVIRGERVGRSQKETWLINAVWRFKATGRAATGDRRSEHKARVHLAKLADECSWTVGEICNIYTGADDYDQTITEKMVRSCIGRQ